MNEDYTIKMTQTDTADEIWTGPLSEWVEGNQWTAEDHPEVGALDPGQSTVIGGGAGVAFTITRVDQVVG